MVQQNLFSDLHLAKFLDISAKSFRISNLNVRYIFCLLSVTQAIDQCEQPRVKRRIIAVHPAGYAAQRVEGCVRGADLLPPSLARVVHHHTTPRTYIFPGGSPTFATITPVAAAFVRATHARPFFLPSSRGGPEAAIHFSSVRIFAFFASLSCIATLRHPYIYLRVQQSGAISLPSRLLLKRKSNCCDCVHFRDSACNPFRARGCARVSYGTCVPRGPRRKIHLLPLLPREIRRAGTTVSDVLRNCGDRLLNFAQSVCPLVLRV